MIKIVSDNGWFEARVDDAEGGVEVVIFQRVARGSGSQKMIRRAIFDVPFHVAIDGAHGVVNALTPEFRAMPVRGLAPLI
jgi:hypothetical protein